MIDYHDLGIALGAVMESPLMEGKPRSSQWPTVRAEKLEATPKCEACERGDRTSNQVHHIKPYHLFPELELERSNLLTMCPACHFVIGHLGDWRLYDPDVYASSIIHRERVRKAKRKTERILCWNDGQRQPYDEHANYGELYDANGVKLTSLVLRANLTTGDVWHFTQDEQGRFVEDDTRNPVVSLTRHPAPLKFVPFTPGESK